MAVRKPAYTPPQLPGFTAPVPTITRYLAYGGTPPSAAPAAPVDGGDSGGGDGGGGYQPFDFSTDPGYLAALAAEQAGSAQLDASLRAAREQAVVRFGDPGLAAAFGISDLSPLTAAMAQQSTQAGTSTLAQLNRQRDLAQQTLQNNLAAHGIIRSGDLGWRTGQNQQNYAVGLYNAQQGVLDSLAQAAASTASQKAGLHTQTVNALTGAYNTYIANPQYWGMAGAPPSPTTATQAQAPAPVVQPQLPGFTAPAYGTPRPTAPVSRLATPSPYRYQAARNVRFG